MGCITNRQQLEVPPRRGAIGRYRLSASAPASPAVPTLCVASQGGLACRGTEWEHVGGGPSLRHDPGCEPSPAIPAGPPAVTAFCPSLASPSDARVTPARGKKPAVSVNSKGGRNMSAWMDVNADCGAEPAAVIPPADPKWWSDWYTIECVDGGWWSAILGSCSHFL